MNIFLAFLIIVVAASDDEDGSPVAGLRVRYGYGNGIGTSFMYDLPRNKTQAIAEGYIQMTPPECTEGLSSLLTMYCMEFYYFCIFYDDTGYNAGVQIGFPKDNITGSVFDLKDQGFLPWSVVIDGVSIEYLVTHVYFISAELLATDAQTRISARNPDETLQDEGVWVTNSNKTLLFVSKNTSEIANNSSFTKQACVPWMGLHYYYNMSSNTLCTADGLLSWFAVVNDEKLTEIAAYVVGIVNVRSDARNVFENPTNAAVEYTVPDGPQCIYDYAENPGLTVIHIYFVDEPWKISCSSSD